LNRVAPSTYAMVSEPNFKTQTTTTTTKQPQNNHKTTTTKSTY
jgi:hypothetical protein